MLQDSSVHRITRKCSTQFTGIRDLANAGLKNKKATLKHLGYKDEAVQAPTDGGIVKYCARLHGEGRDPARNHLAREVLPLEYPHAPAGRSGDWMIVQRLKAQ